MPTTYVAPADNLTTAQTISVSDTLYILEGSISIDAPGMALNVSAALADTFIRIEGGTILNPAGNGGAIFSQSELTAFFGPDSLVRTGGIAINVIGPLNLTNHGTIQSLSPSETILSFANSRLDNFGYISGPNNTVHMTGSNIAVNNHGTISSAGTAINLQGSAPQVVNTGTIIGDVLLPSSAQMVNSGTIIGDVDGVGALGITFDGRFGRVLGVVKGGASSDLLQGGVFADTFNGENGGDFLEGNDGDDQLFGSSGADFLWGGAGGDRLDGGDDGDPLLDQDLAVYQTSVTASLANPSLNTGEAAGDLFLEIEGLNGGSFDDTFFGDAFANTLFGNGGDDRLDGGAGVDRLVGDAGNDTYLVDNAADVVVETGSSPTDTLLASVSYTLAAGVQVEIMRANAGSSGLTLIGNELAQSIFGGDGADTLNGRAGIDTLGGGNGNDTYIADTVTDTITDAGGAFDKVLFTGTAGQTFVLGSGVENLDLLGLAATRGTGNTLGNLLRGNNAANILNGLSGADTLSGGGGIDQLVGGSGNDTYIVDTLTDTLSEGVGLQGGTADTVRFTGAAGQTFTLGANLERLFLQGTTATNGTGNGLANQLTGNHLNNTLRGLGGNDTLFGGSGNDTLIGGAGRDQMSAGAGIDVFRFAAADSGVGGLADVITDFDDAGNDRIDLSTLFGPAMNFRGAQAFTGLGQVRINDIAGADVIVEVNRMGSLAADFAIRLTATTLASMTANDFVL